ncbi:unnamed protein product [Pieris brassicae]|uniref:Gustatory receptor n=1 Tax=Pieris brassicae TaxID=7116 RepID=A0A9P0TF10_PIEBR|nr:unnamed protein product [Pieris brassicae]
MNEELKKLLHEGAYKRSYGAEKVRELTDAYMTISEVIKTVMETGEVGIFLYIMSKLVRLMTRVYNYAHWQFAFQDMTFDYHIILSSMMEIFWCTQTVVKSFLYCEGPHQIHSMLQETQDLVSKLKKKYHEDNISNELHLFLRLTMLSRPTFSPLSVFTLNRGLVAKLKSKSHQTAVNQSLDLKTPPEGTTRPGCWASVVSRKRIVQHEAVPPKEEALLTVPRSAAVLVTLEKEAEENGVTYAEILIRTKEPDKKELFKCKVLTVYLITIVIALFAHSVKLCMDLDKCTYFQKFSHGDAVEKIRKLTNSYTIITDVIKIVMETGEMGSFLYIMGNLLRFMTRAYDYVYLHYAAHDENFDGYSVLTSILEIFWCIQIVGKSFLFCEGPHQIQCQLQETQDLIASLKKKYHEDNISNELHLFLRLTMLSRSTFSPFSVCTLNRALVAKKKPYRLLDIWVMATG